MNVYCLMDRFMLVISKTELNLLAKTERFNYQLLAPSEFFEILIYSTGICLDLLCKH